MNRLKLWLYMVLVLGAGGLNLAVLTVELSRRALAEADASLQVAAAQLKVRERLMGSEAAAVTGLAVRDPELLGALAVAPEPSADGRKKKGGPAAAPAELEAEERARQAAREAAAKAAVEKAASQLAVELPTGSWWAAANPEWLEKNLAKAADGPQKEAAAFLKEAAGGTPRRGYARVNDALWYGVAMPAGQGSALVLFLPLDAAWAQALKVAGGADVTLDVGLPQVVSTARPDLARRLAEAARKAPGGPVGEGRIPPVAIERPVKASVPLLFASPPAHRALAVELSGLPRSFAVLSSPTVGYFAELARYQWTVLAAIVVLAVVGVLMSVLLKTEIAAQVPEELLAAAVRIERGDFSARAPVMAGKHGTVAGALNRAAEAASRPAPAAGEAGPSLTQEFFATAAAGRAAPTFAAPPAPADPFAGAPTAPAARGPLDVRDTTQRLDGSIDGGAFSAAPVPRAEPAPANDLFAPGAAFGKESFAPPRPAAPPPRPTVAVTATSSSPAAAAPPEETEAQHWQRVFEEFVQRRAECGEPTEGLSFDRFRPKLEKNRDQLLQKYGCRAVRFQVYVKDGKAALKATPVH